MIDSWTSGLDRVGRAKGQELETTVLLSPLLYSERKWRAGRPEAPGTILFLHKCFQATANFVVSATDFI